MKVAFDRNEDCSAAPAEAIAAFERERGVILPPDYRKFLSNSPGGCPNPDWSSFGKDGDVVMYVYGIHQGAQWKRLSYAVEQFGHDLVQFLPVAISNGGNYFLLRLAEPDRGAMYFYDHELEGFDPLTFESLIRVSDSFSAWLDRLREIPR
jgi:hypothetical protein